MVPSRRNGSFWEPSQAIWDSKCRIAGLRPRQDRADIGAEIQAWRRSEAGRDVGAHQPLDEAGKRRIGHRLGHRLEQACEQAEVGEGGMGRSPRSRSLACSNGRTSATTVTPAAAKSGAPGARRSSITHWVKRSRWIGQASSRPIRPRDALCKGSSVGQGDAAADHGVGKRVPASIQPARVGLALGAGQGRDGAAELAAVVGEVVAADDARGRRFDGSAGAQAVDQQADGAAGRCGVGKIVGDVGVRQVERAGRGQAVALLGDREGDAGVSPGAASNAEVLAAASSGATKHLPDPSR